MLFEDSFHTIEKESSGEFRDRGSRFIGFAWPVTSEKQVKSLLQSVKKDHPKANHHCYAFRIGEAKDLYRYSDDREPGGSAGKPIYGVILSNDLTNVLLVVVRYFGGTLLGVPGLINAYREAAASAVRNNVIVSRPVTVKYVLEFGYEIIQDVMALLRKSDANISSQEMGESCLLKIEVIKSASDRFYSEVLNHHLIKEKCKITSL